MKRELTATELDLLSWVLPEDRPGYNEILKLVRRGHVMAQGRRGEGHLILASGDVTIDHDSPLPQVLAFGEIESETGECIVTVREPLGDQLDVEITGAPGGAERRRWTFSHWSPGSPCPRCAGAVREVRAATAAGNGIQVVICATDRRVWVHEERTGVNHPVPVTLFYSELMRRTGVKDPEIALDSGRLFTHLRSFSDVDLLRGFASYNDIRSKIPVTDRLVLPETPRGFFDLFLTFFRRKT